jgi:hypothetical protein
VDAQAEKPCLRQRLCVHTRRAPLDVLENAEVRLAHSNEVIAAIGGGADGQISFGQPGARLVDLFRRKARAVAADHDHLIEPLVEMMSNSVGQRVAQTRAALLDQADAIGQELAKARSVAFGVDHAEALPAQAEPDRDCVQQKRTIQRRRVVG